MSHLEGQLQSKDNLLAVMQEKLSAIDERLKAESDDQANGSTILPNISLQKEIELVSRA